MHTPGPHEDIEINVSANGEHVNVRDPSQDVRDDGLVQDENAYASNNSISSNAPNTTEINTECIKNPNFIEKDADMQKGVYVVEAARSMSTTGFYILFVFVFLQAYVSGQDNSTTWSYYLLYAFGHFASNSLYPVSLNVYRLIQSVGMIPFAKVADVYGREWSYSIALLFYTLGVVVMAVSQRKNDLMGGIVLWGLGYIGLSIMQQIIYADYLSARWRAFGIGIINIPYIVIFATAPKIGASVTGQDPTANGWRWGFGMFTIMMPVIVIPIIIVLFHDRHRAKEVGLVSSRSYKGLSIWKQVYDFVVETDLIGVLMIIAGLLLIFTPIDLEPQEAEGWTTPWVIALIAVGGVLLLCVPLFEYFIAPKPIIRRSWLTRDVSLAAGIGFFDFVSYYLATEFITQWAMVVLDWKEDLLLYLTNAQMLPQCLFAPLVGLFVAWRRRYKWVMVVCTALRLFGIGLAIKYRNADSSPVQVVWPQVIQGLGNSGLGIILELSAQVSVPHQDVAMVTTVVLIFTQLGGAVGTSIYSAIYAHRLPHYLEKHLPQLNAAERAELLNGLVNIRNQYAPDDPIRIGATAAFQEFVRISLIAATCLAVVPLALACLLPNRHLPDKQNTVSEAITESEDAVEVPVDQKH